MTTKIIYFITLNFGHVRHLINYSTFADNIPIIPIKTLKKITKGIVVATCLYNLQKFRMLYEKKFTNSLEV